MTTSSTRPAARAARLVAVVGLAVATAGCAASAPEGQLIADPYESLNRDIHEFNKGWDQVLIRPAAFIYKEATPTLFQFLVGNAVDHITLPLQVVNHTLQLDFEDAAATAGRFVVNTVAGAGGLLDPATEFGLPERPTDTGVTLAEWGAQEGPYVVLPFFGPFTGRDAVGRVADFALDPFNAINIPGGAAVTAARVVAPAVDARAANFEIIDDALYASDDSYVTVRTGYVLSRRRFVAGETGVGALPDIYGETEQ